MQAFVRPKIFEISSRKVASPNSMVADFYFKSCQRKLIASFQAKLRHRLQRIHLEVANA